MPFFGLSKKQFHLKWNIENSVFTADACLLSPTFCAQNLSNTKWSFKLVAESVNGIYQLSYILKRDSEDKGPPAVAIQFKVKSDFNNCSCDYVFSKGASKSIILTPILEFLKQQCLTKRPLIIYTTLKLWNDAPTSSDIRCIARTRIQMTNLSRMVKISWKATKLVENIAVNLKLNSPDESIFALALKLIIMVRNEVTIKIVNVTARNVFLSARISVRDCGYSVQDSFVLDKDGNEYEFPFAFSKEMSEKLLGKNWCLKNLFLLFEFFIPDGIESSGIKYYSDENAERRPKAYVHRNFKANNEESRNSDFRPSKPTSNNDTFQSTANTDYKLKMREYSSNKINKSSLDAQATKFGSKTKVGVETSNIYSKNQTLQTSYSNCALNARIQDLTDFKEVCEQNSYIPVLYEYKSGSELQDFEYFL